MIRRLSSTRMLRRLVAVIAVSTVLSGLLQIILPGPVLRLLGVEPTPASRHFFGIVGMFMALFGGALLHALLLDRGARRLVLLWSALQKLGASLAVGIGVSRRTFAPLALAVAGFDLVSCMVIAIYRRRVAADAGAETGSRRAT